VKAVHRLSDPVSWSSVAKVVGQGAHVATEAAHDARPTLGLDDEVHSGFGDYGWADVLVNTVGPWELVQPPTSSFYWYWADTCRPRTGHASQRPPNRVGQAGAVGFSTNALGLAPRSRYFAM